MAGENLGLDDIDIQEVIDVLEKHCSSCQKEGKYAEAALAKSQRQILCEQEAQRQQDRLSAEQQSERQTLEEAHMEELQRTSDFADEKLVEFERQAAVLQEELVEKHHQELKAYMAKLEGAEPRMPRWSKELLRERKVQETLGKLGRYSEAAQVKVQADELEAKEHKEWGAKRQARSAALETQFRQKQQLEMSGLQQRIESGRKEQVAAKKKEMDRLLQRHMNMVMQLETQQRICQHRVEKNPGAGTPRQARTSTSGPGAAVSPCQVRTSTPGFRTSRELSPSTSKLDGSFRVMTPRGRTSRCVAVGPSVSASQKSLRSSRRSVGCKA